MEVHLLWFLVGINHWWASSRWFFAWIPVFVSLPSTRFRDCQLGQLVQWKLQGCDSPSGYWGVQSGFPQVGAVQQAMLSLSLGPGGPGTSPILEVGQGSDRVWHWYCIPILHCMFITSLLHCLTLDMCFCHHWHHWFMAFGKCKVYTQTCTVYTYIYIYILRLATELAGWHTVSGVLGRWLAFSLWLNSWRGRWRERERVFS